ncbi:hypothetical protein Acr_15g0017790 [Actinidia rufa]|uniref:Uncharacterized protein n=1 Tax=Actinidia rufa TaxID=165716 RepID=A0A7J0FWU0_9ERIC|nr:hypothetical protein Acr_15g0017790 [Actinidia rufa]
MKFFLDLLGSCCRAKHVSVAAPPTGPPQTEVSNNMILPSRRIKGCNKSKLVVRNLAAAAAPPWRPSLCTISEDGVIEAEKLKGYAKPQNKQKGDLTSMANFKYCRYEAPYETGLPTLYTVGFLF